MIDYPVFIGLWALVAVFFILNRSAKVNAPERVLREEGGIVYCRDVPISRIFKLQGKAIDKSEIVQVTLAHRCVTLLFSSGKTLEIWLPLVTVKPVAEHAKSLFPAAKFVQLS